MTSLGLIARLAHGLHVIQFIRTAGTPWNDVVLRHQHQTTTPIHVIEVEMGRALTAKSMRRQTAPNTIFNEAVGLMGCAR